jgi:hypothetical protein
MLGPMLRNLAKVALALLLVCHPSFADAAQEQQPTAGAASQPAAPAEPKAAERTSPWLLVPLVSSSPKLGTSFGGMGAYMKLFDPDSGVSMFGFSYQYTSTHSQIVALFGRASFGADHHRIVAVTVFGTIKNDYDDYLGTGQPLKTEDDLKSAVGRYIYRVKGDWFLGGQGIATNYQIFGDSTQDDLMLDTLGVIGFKSVGIGAVAMHDSRDNEDMPTRGWFLNFNNLAYREGLGGEATFDTYRVDFRTVWPQRGRHLMAFRQNNWLTNDAPTVAQATVLLRGYKQGQYLAPYMSSFEAEERFSLAPKWTMTAFFGLAGLYGEENSTTAERQFYPSWGAGIQYILKPAQHMLVNLEYAQGVDDNRGIIMKFGYEW